eukprot:6626581-Prymnesium_polylepis.1
MDMRSVGSGRGRGCVGSSLGAAQSAAPLWDARRARARSSFLTAAAQVHDQGSPLNIHAIHCNPASRRA